MNKEERERLAEWLAEVIDFADSIDVPVSLLSRPAFWRGALKEYQQ